MKKWQIFLIRLIYLGLTLALAILNLYFLFNIYFIGGITLIEPNLMILNIEISFLITVIISIFVFWIIEIKLFEENLNK